VLLTFLLVTPMIERSFVVTYGLRYGRGGIRITGTDVVYAPNLRVAWQMAESKKARHEQVLYVDLPPHFEEDKDLLDYESIDVI